MLFLQKKCQLPNAHVYYQCDNFRDGGQWSLFVQTFSFNGLFASSQKKPNCTGFSYLDHKPQNDKTLKLILPPPLIRRTCVHLYIAFLLIVQNFYSSEHTSNNLFFLVPYRIMFRIFEPIISTSRFKKKILIYIYNIYIYMCVKVGTNQISGVLKIFVIRFVSSE